MDISPSQETQRLSFNLQQQSSAPGKTLRNVDASQLLPGDLLFSSSLGLTSPGICLFSTSLVSHVALYVGDGKVAEAVGNGVPDGHAQDSYFCSEFVTAAYEAAGRPLTLAKSGWVSPADLMHMRAGDVATLAPEQPLDYVSHLKQGIYLKAKKLAMLSQ